MGGNTDILVVGAGPAGLATAIAARQLGSNVMVVDGRQPPIDRACGEGLMPDGVAALCSLGIQPAIADAAPFRGIRFVAGRLSAEAQFAGAPGLGIRRTILHGLLVERAADLGVVMKWATRVNSLHDGQVSVGSGIVTCKWIVGADGHNSRVRHLAGLRSSPVQRRIGVSQHYRLTPWSDFVEVYWHRRGQAYVTPTASDQINVVLMGNDEYLRIEDLPALFPMLCRRLNGAELVGASRSGVTASYQLNSTIRRNIALVGDASGSVDAITGDGLSLAFRQAMALGNALANQDLAAYQTIHRRLIRTPRLMAKLLLAIGRRDWLRRRAIGALATHPTVFARLLAVHTGDIAPAAIRISEVAGLFWRLLRSKVHTPGAIHEVL